MSELNASNLRKEHGNEGPDLVGVTELTSPYYMVPPSCSTAERPQNPQKGTLRFNTDIGSLEYFKGDTLGWEQIVRTSPNLGGGSGSNAGLGGRGIIPGGNASPGTVALHNNIDYVTIQTTGNASDFGDLFLSGAAGGMSGSVCNATRGFFVAGYDYPSSPYAAFNTIQYITIATLGNSFDFGDLVTARTGGALCSSPTRGVTACGSNPGLTNSIECFQLTTLGNAVDFGDVSTARRTVAGASNGHGGL